MIDPHPALTAVLHERGIFIDPAAGGPAGLADRIVVTILADVTDRRRWRHAWDGFDSDVQAEIVATWQKLVTNALRTGAAP